ncbi:FAD-dependent oxidoreductase [[Empedobacter] haloabium]|uniref:FAD-dependent oxidoreductase n=1 Tax=[Empedobacter] haloabium TaxID=592317 RepID=A0ABZ1UIF2_9BURK
MHCGAPPRATYRGPYRGQVCHSDKGTRDHVCHSHKCPNDRPDPGVVRIPELYDATKLVASRFGQDRLRVAGTAEFAGYDKDIRADRIRPLVEWVERCFPGVSTKSVVPWAGLRPMMPDTMPRVGRGRTPFVFYNTGHGHLGWTLAAATAEMVAHEVYEAVEPATGRRRAALAA